MAWVRHGTLVANTVTVVAVPDMEFSNVEVVNRDGLAEIYFKVYPAGDSSPDPTVGGNDCEVLPASMNALSVDTPAPGVFSVKLISAGTPKYSVRAE